MPADGLAGCAVTGRNLETIKELPAEHRVMEGRAVELRVVKRRRGPRLWHATVSWEIGDPGRELHTPGGFIYWPTNSPRPGRALLGSPHRLWAIWRNATGNARAEATVGDIGEHTDAFAKGLNGIALLVPAGWPSTV